RRPRTPTLFPYTTLFRSPRLRVAACSAFGQWRLRGSLVGRVASLSPAPRRSVYASGDRPGRNPTNPLPPDTDTGDARSWGSQRRDRKSTRLNSSHVKISY